MDRELKNTPILNLDLEFSCDGSRVGDEDDKSRI